MEANLIGATPLPEMVENEEFGFFHRSAFSDDSFVVDNSFNDQDQLILLEAFDYDMDDFPFPPPPATADVAAGSMPVPEEPHPPSLSVESDHPDWTQVAAGESAGGENGGREKGKEAGQRHSNSVDGSSSMKKSSTGKKAMAPEKLAELTKTDPQKAKRILANRVSAARSKERKTRYAHELEQRVHKLQVEAKHLFIQLDMLQKENTEMEARNTELKMHIQAIKQETQNKRALKEKLKQEMQTLTIQTEQLAVIIGDDPSFVAPSQISSPQLAMQPIPNPPSQQLQAPQQPQLFMPPPPPLVAATATATTPIPTAPPPTTTTPFGHPFGDHTTTTTTDIIPFGDPFGDHTTIPFEPFTDHTINTTTTAPFGEPFGDHTNTTTIPFGTEPFSDHTITTTTPFGEPFGDHFIGSNFWDYNQLNQDSATVNDWLWGI